LLLQLLGLHELELIIAVADAVVAVVDSSQEARRDFIRTIHHTVREYTQRSAADAPTYTSTVGSCGQSSTTTSSTSDVVTLTSTSTTFGVTRRPESLPTHPTGGQQRDTRYSGGEGGCRPGGGGDRCSMDVDQRHIHAAAADTPRSRCLTLSDLSRSNLAEHGALMHQHLGSQSTLASDRGAGGARLLHTSHDPLHYTSQSAASATLGHHHRGDAAGSPIWKRRHGGRSGASQSPASNNEADGSSTGDQSTSTASSATGAKQRVTFRIPPSAYIETEDTDC